MRLFIAVNLPDHETLRLSHALVKLASYELAVSWTAAESLHITLKFLGEVAEARLPRVRAALEESIVEISPFDVALTGLGAFPSLSRPNIFWIGVSGGDELIELQRRIETAMSEVGFEREQRAFHPHVTLGRVRKDGRVPARKEMDRLAAEFDYKAQFRVESVELMRSRLGPRRARYEVLERMELF